MIKWTILTSLLASCCFGEFRGTEMYTVPASGSLTLTNATSNAFAVVSLCGMFSNGVSASGSFSFWFQRGIWSNKLLSFDYTGVTNFVVGLEDTPVYLGRNDFYKYYNTATNALFLLIGTRYDTQ